MHSKIVLLFGNMEIPSHGSIFLWSLAIILLVISSIELYLHRTKKSGQV